MLELDDIQGNVLAGFNTNFQVFAGLSQQEGSNWEDVASWLADRANEVTTVSEVRSQRSPMKARTADSGFAWLCLAVSERVFAQTQPDVIFGDEAFRRGIGRRAGPVLGDRTPQQEWRLGGSRGSIDVLLIVASNSRDAAQTRAGELIQSASTKGLSESYRETAERIDDLEHFGFRDGVSQPMVIGFDPKGEIEAGHFVFGYPKWAGSPPVRPLQDPRGMVRNGSLLVVRRLKQDVARFRAFCDAEARRIQPQWPDLTPHHLQALIVGRWPQGALVSTAQSNDPGPSTNNGFDFTDDAEGQMCPFGAHIRKVNPRKGPRDVVEVPRLLRRGIPFGPRYEQEPSAERGLLFVSFQTSIVDAFEFLAAKWMNAPEKPAPAAGHDLLVGRSLSTRAFTIKSPQGPIVVSDGGQEWITPTGGAYLFAPSRSGLAKFTTRANVSLRTRATKVWIRLADVWAK